MKAAARQIRSTGFFKIFLSKHELLRVFQIAQQMAAMLAFWTLRLALENCGIRQLCKRSTGRRTHYHPHQAPNIFGRTGKEKMQNGFMCGTKLIKRISYPAPFQQIIFSGYGIMPDQGKPHFDFYRNFAFPQMLEGSFHTIVAHLFLQTLN
jgi:hypothetical protein